ncbi:MAG: hypothetical protein JKY54_07305 [Flavobacteriales bacterium]|nr:hypothetical protein [Flavobacteriales bacterium]
MDIYLLSVIYSAYKSNLPIVLIGLPLIIVGLWLGQIIAGVDALPIENSSTLFGLLKQNFPWLWLEQAFAMLIIVLSGILLNYVVNQEEFFEKQTFIPAYAYVLVMSVFKDYQLLHPIIISNFFMILAIRRLFHIHRGEDARKIMFDAGLFLGVSALFYEYYVIFFLLAWVTLAVLRPFIWREHLLAFVGLILPILFLLVYYFIASDSNWVWVDDLTSFFIPKEQYVSGFIATSTLKQVVGIGVALLVGLLGARFFLRRQKSSSLRFKRVSNIVLFMGLIVVLLTGVHLAFRFESPTVLMSSVFSSFIVTFYFFYAKRQKLAAFIFYLITILAVVNIYYDFVQKIIG